MYRNGTRMQTVDLLQCTSKADRRRSGIFRGKGGRCGCLKIRDSNFDALHLILVELLTWDTRSLNGRGRYDV